MKLFRLALSVTACALWLASSAAGAEINTAKPNIVVFISDDHGMLDSEPYGPTDIHTPNMRRLAADGMKFTHAFACLTGLRAKSHGDAHRPVVGAQRR